jgi:hypothetical protein
VKVLCNKSYQDIMDTKLKWRQRAIKAENDLAQIRLLLKGLGYDVQVAPAVREHLAIRKVRQ